jgi:hypothetical protein
VPIAEGVNEMPVEVPIAIRQADLGGPQSDIDLTAEDLELFDSDGEIRVKVLVDGEPIEPGKSGDSVVFKAPLDPDDNMVTVVVTTKENKILTVLQYDKKGKPIADSTEGDEAELKGLAEAIRKARSKSDVNKHH